jgi:hypothetical protein
MYRASSALQLARSAALMRTPLYGVLGGLVRRALSTASRPPWPYGAGLVHRLFS